MASSGIPADRYPSLDSKDAADLEYTKSMKSVSEELIKLVTYYERDSRISYDDLRGEAILLFAQELDVIYTASAAESERLDNLWRDWADRFIRRVEDIDLSLDHSPDRQRFQDFLDKLSANRTLHL